MNVRLRPPLHPEGHVPAAAPAGSRPGAARVLKVGFLCPHNPLDRRAFSGTAFHAARALDAAPGIAVSLLGPHRAPRPGDRLRERVLGRRAPVPDPDRLELGGLDLVFGLVATPLLDRLALHTHLPFVLATDATPGFLREAYGWDLPDSAEAAETRVARRAAAMLYSSEFMAVRARRELAIGPGTGVFAVPFGINCEALPAHRPDKAPPARPELLFVCSDWDRKGGDIALGALERLRARGIDARLTVVGRMPRALRRRPGVRYAGYLDKNRPRAAARLGALYARAHVLVLPTRADCTPMVVAEAMAHGTPVLATDTGGMATFFGRPGSGRMLPMAAGPADWAEAVLALTGDPAAYDRCSAAAFAHARDRLTWTAWAGEVAAILRRAARHDRRPTAA